MEGGVTLKDEVGTANRGCGLEIGGGRGSWDQFVFLSLTILSHGDVPLFRFLKKTRRCRSFTKLRMV